MNPSGQNILVTRNHTRDGGDVCWLGMGCLAPEMRSRLRKLLILQWQHAECFGIILRRPNICGIFELSDLVPSECKIAAVCKFRTPLGP